MVLYYRCPPELPIELPVPQPRADRIRKFPATAQTRHREASAMGISLVPLVAVGFVVCLLAVMAPG